MSRYRPRISLRSIRATHLALAAKGERLDRRLWTRMAALTDARGNSTSLVGMPQQVAESLAEYYDLGIDIFLIRGF